MSKGGKETKSYPVIDWVRYFALSYRVFLDNNTKICLHALALEHRLLCAWQVYAFVKLLCVCGTIDPIAVTPAAKHMRYRIPEIGLSNQVFVIFFTTTFG